MLQWDESLNSGIPVIDYEHKELVGQLSRLMDESQPNRVPEMLNFLKEYVVKHFAHEQLIQKNSRYPKAAAHKQAHIDFLHTFNSLEEQYLNQGNSPQMLQLLTDTVTDWLKKHIMGEDREFAKFLLDLSREEPVQCDWVLEHLA